MDNSRQGNGGFDYIQVTIVFIGSLLAVSLSGFIAEISSSGVFAIAF